MDMKMLIIVKWFARPHTISSIRYAEAFVHRQPHVRAELITPRSGNFILVPTSVILSSFRNLDLTTTNTISTLRLFSRSWHWRFKDSGLCRLGLYGVSLCLGCIIYQREQGSKTNKVRTQSRVDVSALQSTSPAPQSIRH